MKIVFCGPPHSGKSVFLSNLIEKMPTDSHTILRACPDGEGNWSNNKNQNETILVRKKGKFTPEFVNNVCNAIDNQTSKISLIDVGGVISKENEQIFKHCDSFVIVSRDEESKEKWLQFGNKLGLQCLGVIDSKLEGQDEIYKREPYLQGKITGLQRGNNLENSIIINALLSDIVKKSKYDEKETSKEEKTEGIMIDDTELGFELGYGNEFKTEQGIPIKKVKWSEDAISKVYKKMDQILKKDSKVRLNGIRANFILCAIAKSAMKKGIRQLSTYDIRLKKYIPIKRLPQKRGIKQAEGLQYNIIQNDSNIFMDIDITGEQYTLEEYKKCIIPKLKKNKNLYLSGRIPHWLLASISGSYDCSKIFTFQPGKGFTCISSKSEKDLGTVVDNIEGIDTVKYYNDKRDNNKLSVVQKKGFLSKLKNIFYKKDNKGGYLDNSIVSRIIPEKRKGSTKKDFKSNIKVEVGNKENKSKEKNITKGVEQKVFKDEVGG